MDRRAFLQGLVVGTTAATATGAGLVVEASPQDVARFGTSGPATLGLRRGGLPFEHLYDQHGHPVVQVTRLDVKYTRRWAEEDDSHNRIARGGMVPSLPQIECSIDGFIVGGFTVGGWPR